MTMTRPLRLMILHFSQMGLTEGLTFMMLPPYLFGDCAVFVRLCRLPSFTGAPRAAAAGQLFERQVMRPRVKS